MDVLSLRDCALQSHNFLIKAKLQVSIPRVERKKRDHARNVKALDDPNVQEQFA